MSHDDGAGEMSLNKNGHLDIKWDSVGKQPIFEKASQAMHDATAALGGTYVRNATWNKLLDYDLVTVHPLGGCCMADDASKGVTDHTGNVFAGDSNATHPGLYVLDGAILPTPVGTNPLLTISAVAERACKMIIESMGLASNDTYSQISLPDVCCVPAVQFTETMRGYFSKGEQADFQKGYDQGKAGGSPFLFTLTIKTGDITGFRKDETHAGTIAGTVIAPSLSNKALMVSHGVFNLFQKTADNPDNLRMKYRMQLTTHDGRHYFFDGYKRVENEKGFDLWSDTSTLYITVYEGTDDTGTVVGKGMLKIAPTDFAVQMTTMKAVDTAGKLESLNALKNFSVVFSENVINTYIKRLL
jgi:cholesterol oxidase